MKNQILDDHLMEIPKKTKEKKRSKFKRPEHPIFIGIGRFFIAQAVMMMFIVLLVNAFDSNMGNTGGFFTMGVLVIAALVTMGIVVYNLLMGWQKLTKNKLFDYGDGTFGGIVLVISTFLTIIISIFILYRDSIDMWTVLSSIPIVLFFIGLRWIYDNIVGTH